MDGIHAHEDLEFTLADVVGKIDDTEAGLSMLADIVADLAKKLGHNDLSVKALDVKLD